MSEPTVPKRCVIVRRARHTCTALVAVTAALAWSVSAAAACAPGTTCTLTDAVDLYGPQWALGAAAAMDAIIATEPATGDIATVAANLATLEPAQRSEAAARMVPVIVGQGVQQANLTLDELSSLVALRMDSSRYLGEDAASGRQHLWLRGFATAADQSRDGEYPRYTVDGDGAVVGYDTDIGRWNVGAAYAYSHPQVNSHSSLIDDQMNVESRLLGLYGYWHGGDGWFGDVLGVVGIDDNDTKRKIVFADIARTAIGDYDTRYGRLTGTIGRNYSISDRLTLTPTATFGYTYARDASHTERGAGDLDLHVDDNVSESVVADVDGRFAYRISRLQHVTAHVGAGYRSFTDDASLEATFVSGGPEFETAGASIDPYLLRAGIGYEVTANERFLFDANYEYEYRGKFQNSLLTATLRCRV
jgi:outer membrane autotransporter protein